MPGNTNRREVRIASSNNIRPAALETNADPGVRDDGGAQMFDQAANQLGKMSQRVGALADHAASVEGEDAGAKSGLDPEFRPEKNLTIRGEAFDRAGISVASKRMRFEMSADMDAAFDKYGDDPKRLKIALDSRAQTWAKQGMALDAKVGADLTLSYKQGSLSLLRRSTRAQAARITAQHRDAVVGDVSDRLKRIGREAYDVGLDPEADGVLASSRMNFLESLSEQGVNGKPLFSTKQRRAAIEEFDSTILRGRMRGAMSRTDGLAGKQSIIDGFEEDWRKGKYPSLGLKDFDSINGQMMRDLNRAKMSGGVKLRQAAKETELLIDQASKGRKISSAQRSDILAGIRAGGDQGLLLADETDRNLTMLDKMRTMNPADMTELIEQGRAAAAKNGASPSQLVSIKLAEGLRDEARKQIKSDLPGWLERTGQVDIKPLDPQNPASLAERVSQVDEGAAKYGVQPHYLRPDEKPALIALMRSGPEGLARVAAYVNEGAGKQAVAVMAQLSKDAPALAHIGGLAVLGADSETVLNGAIWQRQRREKGYQSRLAKSDEKSWSVEFSAGAFSGNLQMQNTVGRVAAGLADIMAKKRGESVVTQEIYEEAFQKSLGQRQVNGVAYGGLVQYGDSKVVVPNYVRADSFEQIIENIDRATLTQAGQPLHANGDEVKPADIKRSILTSIGDGRYLVNFGSKEEPKYFKGKGPGGAWVLDLKHVWPSVNTRHPEYFLGGPR